MKYKRNTIPEIEALSAMLRSRSAAKRKAAVEGLCIALEPMIRSLVPKYEQPVQGSEQEDLEQVARVGLLEACKTHDRSKGAFLTHAMWCIRHTLSHYVASLGNPVRLPTTLSFRLSRLRQAATKLERELERKPTLDELSVAAKMPVEAILTMLAFDRGPRSLDSVVANNKTAFQHDREEAWVERFPSDVPSPEALVIAHEEAALRRQRGRV